MWESLDLPKLIHDGLEWLETRPLAVRQSRQERGLCEECGYDLRTNPKRCPECGHFVTPTSRMFIERLYPPAGQGRRRTRVRQPPGKVLTRHYDVRSLLEPASGPAERDVLIAKLMKLVMDRVAPETWHDRGGNTGDAHEVLGQFIVTQTPENHRRIAAVLDGLARIPIVRH